MKILLTLLPVLASLAACGTPPTAAEVADATLWFPPQVKRVAEPRYAFDTAERERAIQEYRAHGDTLFELVVAADGKVEKARLLRTRVPNEYRASLVDHAYRLVFSADPEGHGYRAFYYPVDYELDTTFEWQ